MPKADSKSAEKRVGIWVRVSTEDQVKGESPEHHERRARAYAESKGWHVCEVFRLEAMSGKAVMGYPETKRMLSDLRSGRITGLIFSKLARLARNTNELLEFSEIFRTCNADLISLQESIDTSTPAGRLFYTMIAAMAQWEREEIAERVAASVPVRAKLGKPLGGQAPFGYRWVDRELIPDPREAPVRRLVYDLFLEHKRKKTVAWLLTKAGHSTRNGSKFSDTTVARLLRDPVAKGLRRANYTRSLGDNGRWTLKPEEEWVFIEVEPIVPEALWKQCNQILDEQRGKYSRPTRRAVNLFAGYAFCACGRSMAVPSNSPKYICPKCRNKIPTDDLESVYHEQLKVFFFSEDEINGYLRKADKAIKEKERLLKTLLDEQLRIKQELDKVIKLYVDGQLPKKSVAKHYRPLEERLQQIQAQLPELQGELDFLKIQHLSSDQMVQEARDLHTRWPNLEFAEKRRIVEAITQRIVIGNDEVTLQLAYAPSATELMAEGQHNPRPVSPPRSVNRRREACPRALLSGFSATPTSTLNPATIRTPIRARRSSLTCSICWSPSSRRSASTMPRSTSTAMSWGPSPRHFPIHIPRAEGCRRLA
jgi:site-specific DNA recombinase